MPCTYYFELPTFSYKHTPRFLENTVICSHVRLLCILQKRSQVPFEPFGPISTVFWCLPGQIYLYKFGLAPIEDDTQRRISNWRVSSGPGRSSDMQSWDSWELRVPALLFQSPGTWTEPGHSLTAAELIRWSVLDPESWKFWLFHSSIRDSHPWDSTSLPLKGV